MNIILELQKGTIQLTINNEKHPIRVKSGFYSASDKSKSLQMFVDKETNVKIRKIVTRYRDRLKFIDKLKYIVLRNSAFVILDKEVQPLLTLSVVNAYATLALDAREVFILKRPDNSQTENSIDKLKELAIPMSSSHADTPISKLP